MDPGLFSLLDAVGTVAFAMSGAFKAVRHRLDLLGVLVLGFATAMGGGVVYVVSDRMGAPGPVVTFATFGVTFPLRVMAIWRGWHLPRLPG